MQFFCITITFCTLLGHSFGQHVPLLQQALMPGYSDGSCACGATHPYVGQVPQTPNSQQYPFNYDAGEPKTSETQMQLKSIGYEVEAPAQESGPDTNHRIDYDVQIPLDGTQNAGKTPQIFASIGNMETQKPECQHCAGGICTCKDATSDLYQFHAADIAPQTYEDQAYVLPVRYDENSRLNPFADSQDRMRRSIELLKRKHRQTNFKPFDLDFDVLKQFHAKSTHAIKKAAAFTKEKLSKIMDVEPILSQSRDFFQGFEKNFAIPVRHRRSTDEKKSNLENQNEEATIPMLKIKEHEPEPCQKMENLKQMTDEVQHNTEVDDSMRKQCRECGSYLSESTCKSCGAENSFVQPQYIEYVEGNPVTYHLGARQQQRRERSDAYSSERYVYDRYGHKYLERNGNLRLITPQYQDAIVGQPNFAALAGILDQNQEVMHEVNPFSGTDRMVPPPLDLAEGAIDFIRDLARRQINTQAKMTKSSPTSMLKETEAAKSS